MIEGIHIAANILFFAYILYFFFPLLLRLRQNTSVNSSPLPVSVILAARNEKGNLSQFVDILLNQHHPVFEIIIVNDASTDGTAQLLQNLQNLHPDRLRVIHLSGNGNKKRALTAGIRAARHPVLLLTDADCRPAGPLWISAMTQAFTHPQTEIVLGYGKYQSRPGLLNRFIRFDTLLTALQYGGYTLRGLPYMGVGRNLAYRKSLFEQTGGFAAHQHILSGDDDLFVNRHANAKNTRICFNPQAHTVSVPKNTWREWIRQKRRHITTAPHYKPVHQALLSLFALTYFTVSWFWIFLLFTGHPAGLILLPLINLLLFAWILNRFGKKMNDPLSFVTVLLLTPAWIMFQILIFVLNLTGKPVQWK